MCFAHIGRLQVSQPVVAFIEQYAQLGQVIVRAATDYANDVREGLFPKSTLSNNKAAILPAAV